MQFDYTKKPLPDKALFTILIPTWNNLDFLQTCIESVRKNSSYRHQIVLFVNEGVDGTLEWVEQQDDISFCRSASNVGVCWALNALRPLVETDYMVYLNDDMYVCPEWDLELMKAVDQQEDKFFFLSSTVIEPLPSPFREVLAPYNYGRNPDDFDENKLLSDYKKIPGNDWFGSTWPPNIVHKDIWDLVGGYSIEFSPGLYSDPDFSMKLWQAGVRQFKGIDASRVYHFGSKSTKRVKLNNGSRQFLFKWGITSSTFTRHMLFRGQKFQENHVFKEHAKLKRNRLRSKLKKVLSIFS